MSSFVKIKNTCPSVIVSSENGVETYKYSASGFTTIFADTSRNKNEKSGKFYFEITVLTGTNAGGGITSSAMQTTCVRPSNWLDNNLGGTVRINNYYTGLSGNETLPLKFSSGTPKVIGISVDLVNKELKFYYEDFKNIYTATNYRWGNNFKAFLVFYQNCSSQINFGAMPFVISETQTEIWGNLLSEGFVPYDYENAKWFARDRFIFKSNNNLYSYNNNTFLWDKIEDNKDLSILIEEYGMDGISHISEAQLSQLSKPIKIISRREE